MQIKVYVDVLFLINLISDFLLLSAAAMLLKLSPRTLRLLIASVFGAVYSVVSFFALLPLLYSLAAKTAAAAIMVLIAFGAKNFRVFLKRLSVFFLTALVSGGICYALLFSTSLGSRLGAVYAGGSLYLNIPAYILTIAAAFVYFLLRIAFSVAEKASLKAKLIHPVRISYNGKSIVLPALYDTGNFLTDPNDGRGVIIAEYRAVAPLFCDAASVHAASLLYGFSQITCRGVGGEQQLYAFYGDAEYAAQKETAYTKRNHPRRLLAITEQRLDSDGQYYLILPNDFKGENLNDGTFVKRFFNPGKTAIPLAEKLAHRAGHRLRKLLHKQRRSPSRSADPR